MQTISAIFQGGVITAGFGKVSTTLDGQKKGRGMAEPAFPSLMALQYAPDCDLSRNSHQLAEHG
jgi:hypothetical protein